MTVMRRALACALAGLLLTACHLRAKPVDAGPAFLQALALPSVGPTRYDYRNLSGKVVLVSFFATWCFPCLADMPTLEALQKQYGPQGFQVVAVGMDIEEAKVLVPFADHYALNYPVLVSDAYMRAGQTAYGPIRALPSTVLLDKRGRAVAAWQGIEGQAEVAKAIEKLLRQD
ncbi:TlpA family protein disulfide reductase [Corallococcus sp. H22C18031201]|uniref:TlpA family protein disulfide reductase n=1 Tax=Citreicoccus inhibens TaxID=2849499 RepID=UPI000E708E4F|nr:TlpA disulfide reductase family protein [Citreicoccus inhibens]MBU8894814.1 TlpA family protein disulfide reductase [Citreicoccus inhibens]RJS17662.1 TlpA family protein disulfide reductase [Corallococcus sp. H22C18031201]